jgi:hypothetical protein
MFSGLPPKADSICDLMRTRPSTWLDWPHNRDNSEPTADEWRDHAKACIDDAVRADVMLLFAAEDERQFGSLLETGAALGGW